MIELLTKLLSYPIDPGIVVTNTIAPLKSICVLVGNSILVYMITSERLGGR